jgi:hypothetical protein
MDFVHQNPSEVVDLPDPMIPHASLRGDMYNCMTLASRRLGPRDEMKINFHTRHADHDVVILQDAQRCEDNWQNLTTMCQNISSKITNKGL